MSSRSRTGRRRKAPPPKELPKELDNRTRILQFGEPAPFAPGAGPRFRKDDGAVFAGLRGGDPRGVALTTGTRYAACEDSFLATFDGVPPAEYVMVTNDASTWGIYLADLFRREDEGART